MRSSEWLSKRVQRTITPFLYLHEAPLGLAGTEKVTSAIEAAAVLRAGGTAVLPAGAWDEAERTLRLLNPHDPGAVDRQLRFVQLGTAELAG